MSHLEYCVEYCVMEALDEGFGILKDSENYNEDYRENVNEALQLLLKVQKLIKTD